MSDTIVVPVLIVGGRPIGLSMSILLPRFGVDSLLVENHSGTAPFPTVGMTEDGEAAGLPREQNLAMFAGHTLTSGEFHRSPIWQPIDPQAAGQHATALPTTARSWFVPMATSAGDATPLPANRTHTCVKPSLICTCFPPKRSQRDRTILSATVRSARHTRINRGQRYWPWAGLTVQDDCWGTCRSSPRRRGGQ